MQEALDDLRREVARTKTERMAANHRAFGKMTHEEWNNFICGILRCLSFALQK